MWTTIVAVALLLPPAAVLAGPRTPKAGGPFVPGLGLDGPAKAR
jgi:hypothetical protein